MSESSAANLPPDVARTSEKLVRGMGLLQSTAVNMLNMIGVGPFITIGLILSAMGGPQAILGWFLGALFSICDGMFYAELGAAMPGAGGAYIYFRKAFNARTWGSLVSFLFLWETIFTAPLSISAACVGFAEYSHYFFPAMNHAAVGTLAAGVCALITFLLYRPIKTVGQLSVIMLAVVMVAMFWVVASGVVHMNMAMAFDFPSGALLLWLGGGHPDRHVQLRRVQQYHLPRRRSERSDQKHPARYRAFRVSGRGALSIDERRDYRDDSLA